MAWEAISAIATVVTTVVLVATVVMARRQVELLRRSTQLDGMIRILAEMNQPDVVASYRFVVDELPAKIRDPDFHSSIAQGKTDDSAPQYLPVLLFFEKVGSFIKFRLIDPEAVYCQAGAPAVRAWTALEDIVALDRAQYGPGVWDGFETLVHGTTRYFRQMNPNFPGPYQSKQ